MNSMNFTGNLGRDARLGEAGGSPVANFAVAVKSGYGQHEQTVWVDCSLWGKRADSLAQYLVKGQQVGITGEMGTRDYEKDGVTRTVVTCRVADVTLLGGKQDGSQSAPQPQRTAAPAQQRPAPAQQPHAAPDAFDDDIPFANPYRGAYALIV